MVECNGGIANSANIRSKRHNVWWITLGFKLMPIMSSMMMSAQRVALSELVIELVRYTNSIKKIESLHCTKGCTDLSVGGSGNLPSGMVIRSFIGRGCSYHQLFWQGCR